MKAFINAKLILENEIIENATLLVKDGRICDFGTGVEIPENTETVDCEGKYLAPGYVDIHVHGGGGASFSEDPVSAARHFLSHGETTVLPTLYYDYNKEGLIRAVGLVREAMASGEAENIAGLYMECPYMNPKYGASPEKNKWRGEITREKYGELIQAAADLARVWVVAPEREGIEGFIKDVKELNPNAVISMGHTEATPDEVFALRKYGLTLMTHCMNATGRPDTLVGVRSCGPDEACLMDKDMYAELICDSEAIHVHVDTQQLLVAVKGYDKLVLISDSFVSYEESPEELRYITDLSFDANGLLSGSKLTLDVAVRNFMKHTGASLVDAVKMATINPARAVHLDNEVGSIEKGKKANLILLDDSYSVNAVFQSGIKI